MQNANLIFCPEVTVKMPGTKMSLEKQNETSSFCFHVHVIGFSLYYFFTLPIVAHDFPFVSR